MTPEEQLEAIREAFRKMDSGAHCIGTAETHYSVHLDDYEALHNAICETPRTELADKLQGEVVAIRAELSGEALRLRAELAAARKDTERLEVIFAKCASEPTVFFRWENRAAIDAARARRGSHEYKTKV